MEILIAYVGAMSHGVASIILLSPSLPIAMTYTCMSLVAMFVHAFLTEDFNGPIWNYILVITVCPICFFSNMMFYIQ